MKVDWKNVVVVVVVVVVADVVGLSVGPTTPEAKTVKRSEDELLRTTNYSQPSKETP